RWKLLRRRTPRPCSTARPNPHSSKFRATTDRPPPRPSTGKEKKMSRVLIPVSLFALVAALAAPGAEKKASSRSTERIVREVRHELVMLPYYGVFDNLEYKVDGYDVTLMGQVTRPTLKSDAENVVKRIEGVEHV